MERYLQRVEHECDLAIALLASWGSVFADTEPIRGRGTGAAAASAASERDQLVNYDTFGIWTPSLTQWYPLR